MSYHTNNTSQKKNKTKSYNKIRSISNNAIKIKKTHKMINEKNASEKELYNKNNNNYNDLFFEINDRYSNKKNTENNKKFKENIHFKRKIFLSQSTHFNKPIKKNEINKSNITYDNILGDVGEIIEDEKENELNEFGENHIINSPKSIFPSSSINFGNTTFEHQSLSVSKEKNKLKLDKNVLSSLSVNIFDDPIKDDYKLKNKPRIEEIKNKIKIKNKDIEKIKKLIENIKKKFEKIDNEIHKYDDWIQIEENEGNNLQMMINYLNNNN